MSVPACRFRQKGKALSLSLSQVNKRVNESLMEVKRKSESYLCHMGKGDCGKSFLRTQEWGDFLKL